MDARPTVLVSAIFSGTKTKEARNAGFSKSWC